MRNRAFRARQPIKLYGSQRGLNLCFLMSLWALLRFTFHLLFKFYQLSRRRKNRQIQLRSKPPTMFFYYKKYLALFEFIRYI